MQLAFVSFLSSDKLVLPGLLFTPNKKTKQVAIWLHGMGDNGIFYNPARINALGEALTNQGIALLAFNNRGAHNRKSLKIADETIPEEDRVYTGGTHYETIRECVDDIDGALVYLQEKGFSVPYLIGHSSGANKICVYHKYAKLNPVKKYVLAGPGDDSGLFYNELGPRRYTIALKYAQDKLKQKPKTTMPKYTGMHPFSAQAAFDILNPDGDYNNFPYYEATTHRLGTKQLFEEIRTFDRPTMVIFGEHDEYTYTAGSTAKALDLFRKYLPKELQTQCRYQSLPKTDHGFHGAERQFAEAVAKWLSKPGEH